MVLGKYNIYGKEVLLRGQIKDYINTGQFPVLLNKGILQLALLARSSWALNNLHVKNAAVENAADKNVAGPM